MTPAHHRRTGDGPPQPPKKPAAGRCTDRYRDQQQDRSPTFGTNLRWPPPLHERATLIGFPSAPCARFRCSFSLSLRLYWQPHISHRNSRCVVWRSMCSFNFSCCGNGWHKKRRRLQQRSSSAPRDGQAVGQVKQSRRHSSGKKINKERKYIHFKRHFLRKSRSSEQTLLTRLLRSGTH